MTQSSEKLPLVLIVDDVPNNIKVLGAILKELNCRLAAATDGLQAIEIIKDEKPDLVLLDIMMPKLDGYTVCEKVKKIPELVDIPILFLTAKTGSEDVLKGFDLGAADYITKPFKGRELLARVKMQLDLKMSRDNEKRLIKELQEALEQVKNLSGMLPICANCKKIRDDKGYWEQVEVFISEHSEAKFTHGICPECEKELFPDLDRD